MLRNVKLPGDNNGFKTFVSQTFYGEEVVLKLGRSSRDRKNEKFCALYYEVD